jgi:antitoxin FitA
MNLSIKNVPPDLVEHLRQRAKRNHRSLQGEVLAILEEHSESAGLTVREAYERAKARNFSTPSESVAIIRADRDSR